MKILFAAIIIVHVLIYLMGFTIISVGIWLLAVLALTVSLLAWTSHKFEGRFKQDVITSLRRTNNLPTELLTEADLQHLPVPVQKYLRYAGAINQPKIINVCIVFDGEMRSRSMDWFKFQSVQYNFFDEPTRLFFMKAKMFGMRLPGYHRYKNAIAAMDIKPFGLFSIVKAKGLEMNKAETVTVFNDMCLMAPATLIDKNIQWSEIDATTTKALFINGNITIMATLYFNEAGQLVNFISDDRYDISDMKQYRFSTPIQEYKNIEGRNVLSMGQAVWGYPEGDFAYGKFKLNNITYNISDLKP